MSDAVSRKKFVAFIGTATATAVAAGAPATPVEAANAAAVAQAPAAATGAHPAAPPVALGNEPEAYLYLTTPEARFVEAAVDRLIPPDENGPGARAAGIAFFIDQQLDGVFGKAGNSYREGPWQHGTPMQGYQLRQTPAELYRQAIAACDAACTLQYGKTFAALTAAQQDEVLRGLDGGTLSLGDVPAKAFFELLLQNTIEGFFADPVYGGNRDKAGWKLVGFPGVAAAYGKRIDQWNQPYDVEPVSIADVQQGKPVVSRSPELMDHLRMMGEAPAVTGMSDMPGMSGGKP
jgi:gluconate 2-dehydrogenase gamma chain